MKTIKGIIFIGALSVVASSYSVNQEKINRLEKQIFCLKKVQEEIIQSWDAPIHEQLIGNGFNTEHTPILTLDLAVSKDKTLFIKKLEYELANYKSDLANCKNELIQSEEVKQVSSVVPKLSSLWNSLKTSLSNIAKRQWLVGAGVTITAMVGTYIMYKYMNREEERPKKKTQPVTKKK